MPSEIISNIHTSAPQVLTYASAVAYLRDYYDFRRVIDQRFSYEMWAHEIGFKSKSTLRQICFGQRNISNLFVELFSRAQKFTGRESDYLLLLAKVQNSRNSSLTAVYRDKLAELKDISDKKSEIRDARKFLSDPMLSVLQLLISHADLTATEASLIKLLKGDPIKLREMLNTLESMDLIESFTTDGQSEKQWRSKAFYFSFTEDLHLEAINRFHQSTFAEAESALRLSTLDKKFKSLFFSLSQTDFDELETALDHFTNKLKVKYGKKILRQKKLYKMNFQVYPVSERYE